MLLGIVPGRRSRTDAIVMAINGFVAGFMMCMTVWLIDRFQKSTSSTTDWIWIGISIAFFLFCGVQAIIDARRFDRHPAEQPGSLPMTGSLQKPLVENNSSNNGSSEFNEHTDDET
jgi:hypothetical protein